MSGLWGYQSALDLYLRENGIKTLFFAGVNTDQVRYPTIYSLAFGVAVADLSASNTTAAIYAFPVYCSMSARQSPSVIERLGAWS